jgi:hypothetical protein
VPSAENIREDSEVLVLISIDLIRQRSSQQSSRGQKAAEEK